MFEARGGVWADGKIPKQVFRKSTVNTLEPSGALARSVANQDCDCKVIILLHD